METESIADTLTQVLAESETETDSQVVSEEATTEVETEEIPEETTEEATEEVVEPETVFEAPEHWSSDERESFGALPPDAQEILLEKDKQWQKGYQEKAQSIAAITDAIKPWEQSLAQRGLTPEQAIRSLFAAQHSLETDAVGGILQIAQNYGVLDQLREKFAPTDDDELIDPQFKALQDEIRDLKTQFQSTTQNIEQQQQTSVQQRIEDFKSATDAQGKLLHPHFEEAMPLIIASVQSGKTLEQAYEEAKWTVPAYRESLQQKQEEKTEEEQVKKVRQAKKAARGVKTNGKADPEEGAEAQSLHDQLSEAYRQHSS